MRLDRASTFSGVTLTPTTPCPTTRRNGTGVLARWIIAHWVPKFDSDEGFPPAQFDGSQRDARDLCPERAHRRGGVMDVSWFEDVPHVCEVAMFSDGQPGIHVCDKDESLKLMWAEIQRLRKMERLAATAHIDGQDSSQ